MEDKVSTNFCTTCGAPLRSSDTFCEACGEMVGDSAVAPSNVRYNSSQPKNSRLRTAGMLCIGWAVFAILYGLFSILTIDTVIEALKESPALWDSVIEALTEETLRNILLLSGAITILSGILAAIAGALSLKKRAYTAAVVTCIISAAFGLTMLIGFVGLIVAYMIYKSKDEFALNKKTT